MSKRYTYELPGTVQPGDEIIDAMAQWIEEAEADGFEGEHVFDAGVEDPPHPFWDPVTRRVRPGDY